MKFDPRQNNPVGIILTMVTAAGILGAFFVGSMVAKNQFTKLGFIAAIGVAMLVGLGMGKKIWLLIPLCWSLTGNISILPLPFSIREIGTLAACGTFAVLIAMKRFQGTTKTDILSIFVMLNLGVILSMYLRNPVGTSAIGSETVGGRPYFAIAIAFMAYLLLARTRIDPKLARVFPLILLLPTVFISLLGTLTQIYPSLTPFIAPFYSGIDVSTYVAREYLGNSGEVSFQSTRFTSMSNLGLGILMTLLCYFRPETIINPLYIFRFLTTCFAGFAVLLSGFRNSLVEFFARILIASYLWNKGIGVFRIVIMGVAGIIILISAQSFVDLPWSAQRALSFLPGSWNSQAVMDAGQSTDWRFEMWKIALTTDRYIQNKVLGDGFGFSANELEIMRRAGLGMGGYVDADASMEAFMVQGSFHSGPVSTIRFAGYVGLVVMIAFLFVIMSYSWRVLKRAWNTPFLPLAILLTISATYKPFQFVIIFGEYRNDLPDAIFLCGMLKLLDGSLDRFYSAMKNDTKVEPTAELSVT